MIETPQELSQLAIGASPLLIAVALLFWLPTRTVWIRTKGILASILLFTPLWLLRSAMGTCTDIGHLCRSGEAIVRVNPPFWGAAIDCEICIANVASNFALQLNSWRPFLIIMFAFLATVVAGRVLWQCWRTSTRITNR